MSTTPTRFAITSDGREIVSSDRYEEVGVSIWREIVTTEPSVRHHGQGRVSMAIFATPCANPQERDRIRAEMIEMIDRVLG